MQMRHGDSIAFPSRFCFAANLNGSHKHKHCGERDEKLRAFRGNLNDRARRPNNERMKWDKKEWKRRIHTTWTSLKFMAHENKCAEPFVIKYVLQTKKINKTEVKNSSLTMAEFMFCVLVHIAYGVFSSRFLPLMAAHLLHSRHLTRSLFKWSEIICFPRSPPPSRLILVNKIVNSGCLFNFVAELPPEVIKSASRRAENIALDSFRMLGRHPPQSLNIHAHRDAKSAKSRQLLLQYFAPAFPLFC